MKRSRSDVPIKTGALARVRGDIETFRGDVFMTAPAFIRLEKIDQDPDSDPFLSDQVHIPIDSPVLVIGCHHVKQDDWSLLVLFDGLLLASFYTYTKFTMNEVFEVISNVDQCIG